MQVERSIIINRPVSHVFSFLTNVENAVKWQVSTVETHQISPGSMGKGTEFSHVGKFLGRRIEDKGHVYEYEPNKMFAYRGKSASFSVDISYGFKALADGTQLTLTYGGDPGSFFRIAEPLVARATARLLEGDLKKLKRVLEME